MPFCNALPLWSNNDNSHKWSFRSKVTFFPRLLWTVFPHGLPVVAALLTPNNTQTQTQKGSFQSPSHLSSWEESKNGQHCVLWTISHLKAPVCCWQPLVFITLIINLLPSKDNQAQCHPWTLNLKQLTTSYMLLQQLNVKLFLNLGSAVLRPFVIISRDVGIAKWGEALWQMQWLLFIPTPWWTKSIYITLWNSLMF